MIGLEDAMHTYEYTDYYKILPMIHQWSVILLIKDGLRVSSDFQYTSDRNQEDECWQLKLWIR